MPVIPTKLESIQVLRGIAALLVACVHLQAIEQKYGHEGSNSRSLYLITLFNRSNNGFFCLIKKTKKSLERSKTPHEIL